MTAHSGARALWAGVRMRVTEAAADPDASSRRITLPADWDDMSAEALAALAPGDGAVSVAEAARGWIDRLSAHDRTGGLARTLARLLLLRQAAPCPALWQDPSDSQTLPEPFFVLNLAAFVRPGSGFETEHYEEALRALTAVLAPLAAPGVTPLLLLTNLDACLAGLGLDYDGADARDVARCLAEAASGLAHAGPGAEPIGAPPARSSRGIGTSPVPGLGTLAAAARQAASGRAIAVRTGFSSPGPIDMLLGVEGCGLAPIFSPLRADGRLAGSTLSRLSGRGLTPEAALALSLAGDSVLPRPGHEAWLAMHRALTGLVDRMPQAPAPLPAPPATRPVRRELPSRRRGFTQKAAVGGHRLFLRTGEFEDGSLGELMLTPPREAPATRALMDAFAHAVSLGLQHGVPLEAYVEAFAYSRFRPAGPVEGDGAISHATSMLDYTFRMLSETYLGRPLADAPTENGSGFQPDELPLLPLDLPQSGRTDRPARSGLRLVGGRG